MELLNCVAICYIIIYKHAQVLTILQMLWYLEIYLQHIYTSDCQTFTALVDSEEEEDELFEVSLIVKQAVFGTGLYKINENTVVVTIFDPTLQSKHTCTIFIVSHYNYFLYISFGNV